MTRFCVLIVLLSLTLSGSISAQLVEADEAVAYQINPAHTGAHNTKGLYPPLSVKWSVDLQATVSYPVIVGGKVFVVTVNTLNTVVSLYALDAQTGNTLWGPIVIPNTSGNPWGALAYDNGTLFVVPDPSPSLNDHGEMLAYDPATGNLLWTALLPGAYVFNSPPAAFGGIVYTAGIGFAYGVDGTNGDVLWTQAVDGGGGSSPAVASKGVYFSYECQNYDFAPKTGAIVWLSPNSCSGAYGLTPVLFDGNLYVRGTSNSNCIGSVDGQVLKATTGAFLSCFNSFFAPAFSGSTVLYTWSDSLSAFTVKSAATVWTAFPAEGDSYSSAPIIINGVVYIGTTQGNLIGYLLKNGTQLLSIPMGAPIQASDGDFGPTQAGLGAAEGLLVVPASNLLVALSHQ